MSSPALFPIPLDDIVASGNVWWWDTPPTSMAEYDDNENNRTAYVSRDSLGCYAFCWFVDYNELLHKHVELVNPATDEVHTFAYAAIARRWSASLSHMETSWMGGACDMDTRGWVEISTATREYVALPDRTESHVDTPTFSAKRVTRIPKFFNYTLDTEAGTVSFPNTRESNPLRDIVGESYIRRPTQTLVPASASGLGQVSISDSVVGEPFTLSITNDGGQAVDSDVVIEINGTPVTVGVETPFRDLVPRTAVPLSAGDWSAGDYLSLSMKSEGRITPRFHKQYEALSPFQFSEDEFILTDGGYPAFGYELGYVGSPSTTAVPPPNIGATGSCITVAKSQFHAAATLCEHNGVSAVVTGDSATPPPANKYPRVYLYVDAIRAAFPNPAEASLSDMGRFFRQYCVDNGIAVFSQRTPELFVPTSMSSWYAPAISTRTLDIKVLSHEDCMIHVEYTTYLYDGDVVADMVTEQHGLGGGRGFSYTQGTAPPRGVVMDAVCVDADGQAAEIPCLLSTESDIHNEWRTTGDVVLAEGADIGDLDCAHVPVFYLIPSYTTSTVTGDIIPIPFDQAFIRHHGEASTAALDVMSEGEYRTNATHVAIPLQLLRADSYTTVIGLASLIPTITPTGDADTDAVYIRTLVDYHRDRDGVSLVSPLVRRYIQRFGYLDDSMKPSADPNLIEMGSYIYPCNYVCQDEGDPNKSWFSIRPFRVAQYIGDIGYLRGQSSWVSAGANTSLAAYVDSDDGRRRHMYITDDLDDGFGFAVCSLDFPLDYNDDYFGKVMWFKRSKAGYGSTTLVTVAAPILNAGTALGQEYKYTFDITANVWLPCCYGLTIGGQRWYMVNVGYTRDSGGMVVACDNIRWFTLGDSGNADITVQYRDLADGSVRTTVEQS